MRERCQRMSVGRRSLGRQFNLAARGWELPRTELDYVALRMETPYLLPREELEAFLDPGLHRASLSMISASDSSRAQARGNSIARASFRKTSWFGRHSPGGGAALTCADTA